MSNEENVAKYIIRQTPIGHLDESLSHLKCLIGNQTLESDPIKGEIQTYQEDHLAQLKTDNGDVVMSSLVRDSENYYHDQGKGIKFQFDADKIEAINVEPSSVENELRNDIEAELKGYLDKYYKPEVTKTNVYYDQANGKHIILISVHNFNTRNFWSGEWNSSWELSENGDLKGNIKTNTYYYESGNVQFNMKNDFNLKVTATESKARAAEVIKAIETTENGVHLDLDKIYEQFSDNYIKPLRKNIPLTKTKMNWSYAQIKFN